MTSRTRWIIGRGLLGTAVAELDPHTAFFAPIDWDRPDAAIADLHAALDDFSGSPASAFEIYWCAGKGVTSTPRAALEAELQTFTQFLELVTRLPESVRARLTMFLASSVGGAYAGSASPPFTESTPPQPLSAYGETKLAMESALSSATASGGWRSFVARITNLYSPAQDMSKGQGLLSVIASSYIARRPASIYVSLDTLRDYIYAGDCARVIDAAMARVSTQPPGTVVVKIVGAMTAQSIGAVLGEMRRLHLGRRAPIVLGQGATAGQAPDLRVRSEVWTDLDSLVRTTIPEGLAMLRSAQLAAQILPRR